MTARTLWGTGKGLDRRLLDHTAGEDRPWDARLLRWDVLGSLGHIEGLRAAGLPFDEALVGQGDFYQPRGFEAALELLRLPEPPTALFASNDVSAFGALAAVRELRLRVPDDISVVGFDDIPSARQIYPPLTTVRQPLYEMGAAATRLLLSLLRGGEAVVPRISLPTVLVVRESTAPAKGGHH